MAIISAAELAAHLRIDDTEDALSLELAASAASDEVHDWCGELREFDRTEIAAASARVFRADYDRQVCLVNDFWDTSALVVKVDDSNDGSYTTTWTLNTDFILEPLNARRAGQTWPYYKILSIGNRILPYPFYNRPTVQITAAWGWAAVPDPVRQAALIQGARIFKRRTSPEGVIGGFADFGAVRISTRIDPDVQDLLNPYRRDDAFGIA